MPITGRLARRPKEAIIGIPAIIAMITVMITIPIVAITTAYHRAPCKAAKKELVECATVDGNNSATLSQGALQGALT